MVEKNYSARVSVVGFCALAALIMAYGWGYRGTVGHEAGAMVPGALLGLSLCLGSGRLDWYRRTAVVGLFAAAGWAWGGSLSYMEQTFFVASDSFPDVLFGYSVLFFLGALWAGCGGAILGLAFTEPRSELERLARVFAAVCSVFFVVYLILQCLPELAEKNETLTVRHFHDGDWLSATLTLLVSGLYWLVRPKDRRAAALFFFAALAWWIGYGVLTQALGLRLGPWHRSESWGGVLGILVTLIIYLWRRNNRAALMLCRYGILGGGFGFSLAVFLRHPAMAKWRWFENWPDLAGWRFSEDMFGFFTGLAIAFGALRFLRGGLTAPKEDTPRASLDVFAVFVMLVALIWINFRRHFVRFLRSNPSAEAPGFLGIGLGWWIILLGALISAALLYGLHRYRRGDRELCPQSAFGKGAVIALLLLWVTVVGQLFDGMPRPQHLFAHYFLAWVPAAAVTILLVHFSVTARHAVVPSAACAPPSDPKWRAGAGHFALWCAAPVFLLAITWANTGMQEEGLGGHARKRFGPEAYHRQTGRLIGTWKATHFSKDLEETETRQGELPLSQLSFDPYRNVVATLPSGKKEQAHRWALKNQYTWLQWHDRDQDHPDAARTPIQFNKQHILIAWPPKNGSEGFLVFERVEE
jgi:hypothetical protein